MLTDRGHIYLSGGMQFKENLGADWRREISVKLINLGYFPIDICDIDIKYTYNNGQIQYNYTNDVTEKQLLQLKSDIRHHFIYTDLELVKKNSDAVIVLWDESSQKGAGTHAEIACAYSLNIPVFMVTDFPRENMASWLVAETTKIFDNMEELLWYLNRLPYGILIKDMYGNHCTNNMYLCSLCGEPFLKNRHHFVSTVSPLYCSPCVDKVLKTREQMVDRYTFAIDNCLV